MSNAIKYSLEMSSRQSPALRHVGALRNALDLFSIEHLDRLTSWAEALAPTLLGGGRLLAAGNGGSAAHAQHLCAELVGRYERERRALSAICLSSETSSLTAIANDYGSDELFARQVRAHGRPGDVLLALSTSGSSANILSAARTAADTGMTTWALTGRMPNPLGCLADDAVSVDAATPTVQEIHQIAIHILCEELDRVVLQ